MTLSMNDWKSIARRNLAGRYGILIFSIVLCEMISFVLSALFLTQNVTGSLFLLCGFIISLLVSLLYAGLGYMYLQTARSQPIRIQDLLFALNHYPDTVLLMALFMRLAAVLTGIPVFALRSLFPLGKWLDAALAVPFSPALLQIFGLYILLFILWAAIYAALMIRYAMAWFIYMDHPSWSFINILRESRIRMSGHLLTYAGMLLSFIGLLLMGLLSLGIGLLWVMPYIYVSSAQFYLDLTGQLTSENLTGDGSLSE